MNQTKESALQIHPVDVEGDWNTKSVDPDHSQQQYWQHGKVFFSSYMFARSPACSALCVRAFYVDLFGAFSQSVRVSLDQLSQFTNKDLSSNKPLGADRGSKQKTVYTYVNQLYIYTYIHLYIYTYIYI